MCFALPLFVLESVIRGPVSTNMHTPACEINKPAQYPTRDRNSTCAGDLTSKHWFSFYSHSWCWVELFWEVIRENNLFLAFLLHKALNRICIVSSIATFESIDPILIRYWAMEITIYSVWHLSADQLSISKELHLMSFEEVHILLETPFTWKLLT